ncbi:tyrosine phosphatase family protein [Paenochrobactrum sp. BZR 588]|uniref:tyrosine phosphatase family protein n=1 Tax=unclassified Paenochrobactrum TaxID=2639760 RepID=UPI003854D40E
MAKIVVAPQSKLAEVIAEHKPQKIITLVSPDAEVSLPLQLHSDDYLRLNFNDITELRDGYMAPEPEHIHALLDFSRTWSGEKPLFIHCYAGISRSTAAAYILACALQPKRDAQELADVLRRLSPSATPNIRLVSLADEILGCNGAMRQAIQNIGRGADAFEGSVFTLIL